DREPGGGCRVPSGRGREITALRDPFRVFAPSRFPFFLAASAAMMHLPSPMKLATSSEMRAIDARASEKYGIPTVLLMENAGAAVARRALAILEGCADRRVAIYCGKGNNGGDGLVAARHLADAGSEVW